MQPSPWAADRAAPIATGQDTDYVWNIPPLPASVPADLRARLVDEVAQMVKAGHLAPLPLIGGVGFASGSYPWDLGGATYSPYTLAWLNPADTILALSQAFPLLPADQQTSLRSYLRAELDAYPIDPSKLAARTHRPNRPRGRPITVGRDASDSRCLPDLTYNLWPPLRPPIDNLYALWAYANATDDWGYVQGRWPTISGAVHCVRGARVPDTYGQIGGLIGFARIARHLGHEPEAQAAADLAARGLQSGADFAAFVKTAEGRRSNTHAVSYPVFSYLTPEVGAYLRDHSRDAVAAYVAEATATATCPPGISPGASRRWAGRTPFSRRMLPGKSSSRKRTSCRTRNRTCAGTWISRGPSAIPTSSRSSWRRWERGTTCPLSRLAIPVTPACRGD